VRLVLYAASTPHASELAETIRRLGWELAAAIRNVPDEPVPAEAGPVVEADELDPELLALPFAVPQTTPADREAATADARARGFGAAATLVDPSATVAHSATLGEGVYVGAGAVVGAGARLGEGCLVNRSGSVAHHCRLEPYASSGPGIVVAGCCTAGRGAFLGAGCVIAPELSIGARAVVGAGAVVIRDVAAGDVVTGNPARVLREGG
jgi:sugar O-acyltransferase (sialic acid O-acetyltransferase NeuD family)